MTKVDEEAVRLARSIITQYGNLPEHSIFGNACTLARAFLALAEETGDHKRLLVLLDIAHGEAQHSEEQANGSFLRAQALESELAALRALAASIIKDVPISGPPVEMIRLRLHQDAQAIAHLRAHVSGLTERLNHAVSELTRAALSDDFDTPSCLREVELIKGDLDALGRTSDWHQMVQWHDRLCAACGVGNRDEIDIISFVEKRLEQLAGEREKDSQELLEQGQEIIRLRSCVEASSNLLRQVAGTLQVDQHDGHRRIAEHIKAVVHNCDRALLSRDRPEGGKG